MTRKQLTYIFVALAVIIAFLVVWYFFFRDECDPENNGYTKKGKPSNKCIVLNPSNSNTPVPSGATQWVPDTTFPIKKGSWGSKVKAVQHALGIAEDGKFGAQTESALYAKIQKTELNQAEYNNLINPAATGGGTNFLKLKQTLGTLGKNFSDGVQYPVTGKNANYTFAFYTNGRFTFSEQGGSTFLYKGSYSDGGKTMSIDGGKTYQEGGVFLNTIKITNELGK